MKLSFLACFAFSLQAAQNFSYALRLEPRAPTQIEEANEPEPTPSLNSDAIPYNMEQERTLALGTFARAVVPVSPSEEEEKSRYIRPGREAGFFDGELYGGGAHGHKAATKYYHQSPQYAPGGMHGEGYYPATEEMVLGGVVLGGILYGARRMLHKGRRGGW
eukprot:comp18582_c0_seq1/m.20083 comp18582_c0_seq1/g.20083  ORF comp18582_c0_seq1/g.20083 comp18582_c0_seq1/m.20083 type:complete len:162 (-) comp18582_c0_seq1:414-899(-)